MKSNSEQLAILRDNIQFGLYQGKETKASLSRKTGITRSTIYKILDGKVERVQAATVEKIAGFFGTTCYIIQNESLESHCTGSLVSIDGNKNPIAVPILTEHEFILKGDHYVNEMVTEYPLTYHFSQSKNVVAIQVGASLSTNYTRGNLLIVDRSNRHIEDSSKLIVRDGNLCSVPCYEQLKPNDYFFGSIMEERYCV
ncbi:helix-turn-helix domain-containing protein [Vibrio pectenicida]|uniref:Helix-turn-helix domain-containing protein n=1 Tax=Vibrio pectenicida TaxID=62763 RepID=A0A7Y3ZZC6_9VIBR|nr:helix-turn-helix domain-containing protein [Vibrio pectenicida]NOH71683.1 helix-turn-helix domain-containing protein [Vibrio pectenicida]